MALIRGALQRVFPDPGYPGWIAAGIGLLCATLSAPGQSFALSFYLEPIMAEVGISRLAISTLYSIATLAAALVLPFVGARADRTTGGRYLGTVLLLMAGGMLFLAATTTVWMLAVAFFALRLLGQGAIGIGTLTLTVRWFERYRGRAFAMVALGYAIGEVSFPSAILGMFGLVGWRGSLVAFAGAYVVIFAPLVYRLGRDPEPRELARERGDAREETPGDSHRLGGALKTPVFYGMALVQTVSPLVITALLFHQVGLFRTLDRDAGAAAQAMVGYGIAAVVGTYLAGFLVERVAERIAISIALLPLGAGLVTLWSVPEWGPAPVVYGALIGGSAGALKIAGALVWPAYYGPRHIGAIKGAVTTIRNAATAAGPPLAALLAGPTDNFEQVLLPFAATAVVASGAVLFLVPPGRSGSA
ncbi:MAG TPA: MFS transporter [Longimicrobiales bacterium]|nr:MFS transporter [Longimicrobiales bacterium]